MHHIFSSRFYIHLASCLPWSIYLYLLPFPLYQVGHQEPNSSYDNCTQCSQCSDFFIIPYGLGNQIRWCEFFKAPAYSKWLLYFDTFCSYSNNNDYNNDFVQKNSVCCLKEITTACTTSDCKLRKVYRSKDMDYEAWRKKGKSYPDPGRNILPTVMVTIHNLQNIWQL